MMQHHRHVLRGYDPKTDELRDERVLKSFCPSAVRRSVGAPPDDPELFDCYQVTPDNALEIRGQRHDEHRLKHRGEGVTLPDHDWQVATVRSTPGWRSRSLRSVGNSLTMGVAEGRIDKPAVAAELERIAKSKE
jgi:hypothetical protein